MNLSVIRVHRFSGALCELGLALWFDSVRDLGWLLFLGFSVCRFGGSTEAGFKEDEDTRGFAVFTHGSREIGVLLVFSLFFWVLLFFASVRRLMKEEKMNRGFVILGFVAVEGGAIATMWLIMKFSHLVSECVSRSRCCKGCAACAMTETNSRW
ncbi:uncharacterized protein HKW66_Vig0250010 [Vigna angularis]|uniref:Transmembrane protein n=2 Tax=Phaseolus angularis TaxID=3914 RepID=A0A8T0KUJ6_PHAAN|nr:uncharacterized protein HKW66_Vig0250010 [Vigna angularis]BAT95556.1 hypothetical protein VIGAN_08230800 [Vigna angularis var. angularis]